MFFHRETLPLPDNEKIVLMLGDSAKADRPLANLHLEQDGVNGNGEQFQSDFKQQVGSFVVGLIGSLLIF